MTQRKINQHLQAWRNKQVDVPRLREAYLQRIMDFTLNTMAMENEPVDRARVEALCRQLHPVPAR